jgi:hypothetical protein
MPTLPLIMLTLPLIMLTYLTTNLEATLITLQLGELRSLEHNS